MMILGAGLIGLGALFLLFSAIGVLVLPDALSRQHAATKAVTLSLALILVGAMFVAREAAWSVRLAGILALLLLTLPVASHMLARAAAHELGEDRAQDPLL
jgi:multicomponent Na+:H+ antiporter subunit G